MGVLNDKAELLADRLELPGDALTGALKLTVTGRSRMLLENHKGIINYEENMISVDCGGMSLTVRGDSLSLGAMNKDDMLITGRFISIEFE